jgi:hypothetical protein
MEEMVGCMNAHSECVCEWGEWKEWSSEPPQKTDFPHKTACPKSNTYPHEVA